MRFHPVGAHALLVELDDDRDAQATYAVIGTLGAAGRLPQPRDVVPGARTVLIDGLADAPTWAATFARAMEDLAAAEPPKRQPPAKSLSIRMRYDGPDLGAVAAAWHCGAPDVVRRHQATTFTVAFCGFAPGFAYCTGDPALPAVPRRDDPRPDVPAGAVGLAGPYCGVYPRSMPGGWQLIGTTSEVMFDPERDRPSLLQPGDRVRFQAAR